MLSKNGYSLILFIFIIAAILIASCAQPGNILPNTQVPVDKTQGTVTQLPTAIAETPGQVTTQSNSALDPQSLKNLEYHLGIIKEAQTDGNGVINLKDGLFAEAIPNSSSKLKVDYVDSATGDLNGDGVEDAVVLLAINTGGTGTFMQLAAVLNQIGQLKHIDTADLGDRTKVNSIQIEDGIIKVQTIVHSASDPQCCPSLEKLQEFVLQGDRLIPMESK